MDSRRLKGLRDIATCAERLTQFELAHSGKSTPPDASPWKKRLTGLSCYDTTTMSESFLAGDPPPLPFADTHPAWCAAHGRRGNRLAVGASVIGSGHIRRYRARDDAFVLMAGAEHMIVAVADGVGGEMYSRIGAAHCVNAFCRDLLARVTMPLVRRPGVDDIDMSTLPRQLAALGVPRSIPTLSPGGAISKSGVNWDSSCTYRWNWRPYRRAFPTDLFWDDDPPPAPPALDEAVLASLIATRESLFTLAASLRLKPRYLTCTILAIAVHLTTGDTVAAQLGDGAILGLEDLAPVCQASPRNGDDNPFTIADDNWRDGLRFAESKARGFLLMTDGTGDFFPDAGPACREVLAREGDDSQRTLSLLDWLQSLTKPDCEDDRTLAAILPL
ncbi:MAG TPA: protein phosphatase 2C domain-containing protein [Bryobacteraceae bacterium]|nr:protein phosphatase 2C domain-containing protein [Bryobacteraceae bacterium]